MPLDPETFDALIDTVRRFVAERLRPLEEQVATEDEVPEEIVREMREMGLFGLSIPEEFGGGGLGITDAAILLHSICAAGAGTSGAAAIHFYMFPVAPVIKYGSAAMKQATLPRVARGELAMFTKWRAARDS